MAAKYLKINKLKWPRGLRPHVHLAIWTVIALGIQMAHCATNATTKLKLYPTEHQQVDALSMQINDAIPFKIPSAPTNYGQLVVHTAGDQPSLVIKALERTEVELEVETFTGWRAQLPPLTQVSVNSSQTTQDLTISAKDENPANVRVFLPDGAHAELVGGSSVRFEQFGDESYNLFAAGKVQTQTADGAHRTLDTHLPPLSGGPIVEVTNRQGQTRLRRVTPSTQIHLREIPGKGVVAGLAQAERALELGVPTSLSQGNGAAILLEREADGLRFEVERGYFILSLPGGTGCEPHVWTGQAGRVRWDAELKAVELAAERGPILVALPNQSHATVQPDSSFQFARLNEHTFAASTGRGSVQLYDPVARTQIQLSQAQTVARTRSAATSEARLGITLSADTQGHFALTEGNGNRRRLSTADESWQLTSGHRLSATYDEQSTRLVVEAVAGRFLVQMSAPGLEFELDPPNSMTWRISPNRPTTQGRASAANPTAVAIRTRSGEILLSPGGELLIMSPTWTMGLEPSVVFSEAVEAAGSQRTQPLLGTGTVGTGWLLGLDPTEIYVPRIEQPPVSVVR